MLRFSIALSALAVLQSGCSGCGAGSSLGGGSATPSASASLAPRDEAALRAAYLAKGKDYVPRTRHLNPDGSPTYINRLILENSPYLLQHAHNPVDWFPWGDEAFAQARALGRPVFISIGYSTCHWCHVMEEESFEDEAVARYLNAHYVSIKVDREERPDVDATYMAFVQAFNGSGGWPMNVWLTPDRVPFFGGTYFPPRGGSVSHPNFSQVLAIQSDRYGANPSGLAEQAKTMRGQWANLDAPLAGDIPSAAALTNAVNEASRRFDSANGGMSGAPKFPSTFPNRLLLRVWRRTHDPLPLRLVTSTLDHMAQGGIHDVLGGGFHRYSTDAHWLVPHFEKMLYDNALLAIDYLEAGQVSGDARYQAITRETLDYLLREMQAPDGTFYSATDADSMTPSGHREEGAFFTWSPDEMRKIVDDADAPIAISWFGLTDPPQVGGRNVLHTGRTPADLLHEITSAPGPASSPKSLDEAGLTQRIESMRKSLFEARAKRPKPLRDDKIIVAWNGLTISALARSAIVLGDKGYADAALKAGQKLFDMSGDIKTLPHELIDGKPKGLGFAEDYAALGAAFCDLFELTADPVWLTRAIAVMNELEASFSDPTQGGYFSTSARHEQLLLRDKPMTDGPQPSATAMATLTWLRLSALTGDENYRKHADAGFKAASNTLTNHPLAMEHMAIALDWTTDADKEIVIVTHHGRGALAEEARPFLDVLKRSFVPNASLFIAPEPDLRGPLGKTIPWAQDKVLQGDKTTAYVCENRVCKLPTSDPKVFAEQVLEARPYP